MFWVTLLIWVATTLLTELIRPKPNFEDARPASLGDFNFPTATEGRVLPLIWGRVKISGPNLIWYGGFNQDAITEEVKTGMFSSDDVVVGYRYHVGMQFGLCHGPVEKLTGVWINEKSMGVQALPGGSTTIDKPTLFGGEENGQGGMYGTLRFHGGAQDQAVNAYLTSFQDPCPAYRGTCYAVWESGWIGNSPNVAPWAFEVERYPDGLNLNAITLGAHRPNDLDANPMNVLYEIMTNTDWGLAIPSSDIDIVNFQTIGIQLYGENNGFSMVLDSAMEVTDLIQEIQRQIDGSLFFNRAQGQWQVRLVRADYDPDDLPTFDNSLITELIEFTRQTWEETTNQVRVQFSDRSDAYKTTYALAQDAANMDIQGQSVQSDINYPGVKSSTLANALAWRDLRVLSYPLCKARFRVNRAAFNLAPGSLFKFTWNQGGLQVDGLVMRVATINYGKLGKSDIEVSAFEDIFSTGAGVFGDAPNSGWTGTPTPPEPVLSGDTLVLEAPRQIVQQDPYNDAQQTRVWCGARYPGGGTVSMRIYSKVGDSRPISDPFTQDANIQAFLLVGALTNNLAAYGGSENYPTSYTVDVDQTDTLTPLVRDGDATLVDSLVTIAYIDGEYIGYEKAEIVSGKLRLSRLYRGLFNSAPKAHAAGTRVWFISSGGNLTRQDVAPSEDEMDVQLRTVGSNSAVTTEEDTPVEEITLTRIYRAPLAPRNPKLNGVFAPTTEDVDTGYAEIGAGEDGRGMKVAVLARDWLVDQITRDDHPTGDYFDHEPEFDFYLILDPAGAAVPIGPYTVSGGSLGLFGTYSPETYVPRNDVIAAAGQAAIPGACRLRVVSRHSPYGGTEITNPFETLFDFTLTSTLQARTLRLGLVGASGTTPVAFPSSGTYHFQTTDSMPPGVTLQASVNGGAFATLISSGSISGNLGITAGDTVSLRIAGGTLEHRQFLSVNSPVLGYGVLEGA